MWFQLTLYLISVTCVVFGKVVVVDYKNVDSFMASQPALLEFYAPWCKHCKQFEKTYEVLAERLEAKGFSVGRVDISTNQALTARFSVDSIPAFFLYRDNKMWTIDGKRTAEEYVDFCTSEHKSVEPIDLWFSAMGPIGKLRGMLIRVGGSVHETNLAVSDYLNIPYFLPYVLIAILFAVGILSFTFLGIYVSVTHTKQD